MEIFLASQPIFDKHQNVFAYELLYRASPNSNHLNTDDRSTA
jgi:c-di-GMP-related signal transduction protein